MKGCSSSSQDANSRNFASQKEWGEIGDEKGRPFGRKETYVGGGPNVGGGGSAAPAWARGGGFFPIRGGQENVARGGRGRGRKIISASEGGLNVTNLASLQT